MFSVQNSLCDVQGCVVGDKEEQQLLCIAPEVRFPEHPSSIPTEVCNYAVSTTLGKGGLIIRLLQY